MSKTVGGITTEFAWSDSGSVPVLLGDGSTYYVYGQNGQPIEQITASTPTYLLSDQQGSIRLVTNSGGQVVGRYTYDPWGNVNSHTGAAASDLQYNGQYTDAETGYQYLRARYYDPSTGEFVTVDPARRMTQEPYLYAAGNPESLDDPSGLWAVATCVAGDGEVGAGGGGSLTGEVCDWQGGNGLWPNWQATTITVSAGAGFVFDADVGATASEAWDTSASSPEDLAGPGCDFNLSFKVIAGGGVSVGCNGIKSGEISGSLVLGGGGSLTLSGGYTGVIWSSTGFAGWGPDGPPDNSAVTCSVPFPGIQGGPDEPSSDNPLNGFA